MPTTSKPDSRYDWLDDWVNEHLDGALTVTVVSGRTPEQVLATVGTEVQPGVLSGGLGALNDAPGTGAGDAGALVITLGAFPVPHNPGWVLASEWWGVMTKEAAGELSAPDGTVVSIAGTGADGGGPWLCWAEHGEVVADMSLWDDDPADLVDGTDKARLEALLRSLSINGDYTENHPHAAGAAVVEAITGVVITRELLEGCTFTLWGTAVWS